MKSFKILLFAVIILFIHSVAYSQSITITSPNGGENWVIGTTHNITWTSSGITTGTFTVRLFDGTTSIGIIQAGISCTDGVHSISWTVGNLAGGGTASSGSNFKIKVRQASLAPKDFSDAPFTISEPGGEPPGIITAIKMTGVPVKRPDLKITMHFNPPAPVIGDELTTTVRVVNIGPGESVPCKMRVRKGSETPIPTWNVPALKLGEYYPITIKWILPGAGYVNWYADVDNEKITSDIDYNNNVIQKKLNIKGPDLIVCFSNNSRCVLALKGYLAAYVKNIGSAKSTPCKLRFYMKKKGTKIFDIPALNNGEVFTVYRSYRWYTLGTKRIDIRVDSDNTVIEANERNNFLRTSTQVIRLSQTKYYPSNYICSNGNSGSTLDSIW